MAGEQQQDGGWAKRVAGSALDTGERIVGVAGDHMLKDLPEVTRYVLKKIPDGPGYVYDIANIATAKDKPRAFAGIVGNMAGGALGVLAGAPGGPVGSVVGGVAGSAAGEELGTRAYDATADFYRDHQAQIEATKKAIEQRTAEILGR